jgi:hypothetical protein
MESPRRPGRGGKQTCRSTSGPRAPVRHSSAGRVARLRPPSLLMPTRPPNAPVAGSAPPSQGPDASRRSAPYQPSSWALRAYDGDRTRASHSSTYPTTSESNQPRSCASTRGRSPPAHDGNLVDGIGRHLAAVAGGRRVAAAPRRVVPPGIGSPNTRAIVLRARELAAQVPLTWRARHHATVGSTIVRALPSQVGGSQR